MTRCQKCQIKYPSHLVDMMTTSLGNILVCGICALELSNELHGIKRDKFVGTMAEEMRQGAIKFREQRDKNIAKNHPKEQLNAKENNQQTS